MSIWVLSIIIRPTEFFSAFVVIFINGNFNRLQLSARHYKMPAQQQAVDVVCNLLEKSELISPANGFHIVHSLRLFVRPFLALVIKNPGRHSG
jgi:uncharacterized membrane protein